MWLKTVTCTTIFSILYFTLRASNQEQFKHKQKWSFLKTESDTSILIYFNKCLRNTKQSHSFRYPILKESFVKHHIFRKQHRGLKENNPTTDQSQMEAGMQNICIKSILLENPKPLCKSTVFGAHTWSLWTTKII